MKIKDVAKLSPLERFLYWIQERHQIYLRRRAGNPKPWTDDRVLQTVFFTNPYRENDKTTVWFREHIRDPLKNRPEVLFATVCFRWFNYIPTGELLRRPWHEGGSEFDSPLCRWKKGPVVRRLSHGGKVFTGAYMIKAGNGPPGCKVGNVCNALDAVWDQREMLVQVCEDDCRLQSLWEHLRQFKYLGKFMSYEIVCDLRYTYLLQKATDVDTWANPGPGALRGLLRLEGGIPGKGREDACRLVIRPIEKIHNLLSVVRKKLAEMPRFEMREVEHSLCEWDKFERARTGLGGRIKRRYKGV